MSQQTWFKIHLYLSLFFLPLAFIYAITGGLIILGNYGDFHKENHVIKLTTQFPQTLEGQQEIVTNFLKEQKIPIPKGTPKIVRGKFIWGRLSGVFVNLKTTKNGYSGNLFVRQAGWLNSLVMLHKAKGGKAFDHLGISFAIAMIILYLSGIILVWKAKPKRKAMAVSFILGTIVTIACIFASI